MQYLHNWVESQIGIRAFGPENVGEVHSLEDIEL